MGNMKRSKHFRTPAFVPKTSSLIRILRITLLAAVLCTSAAQANNVMIGPPSVVAGKLQFTLAWDNSWNTASGPANWDAVWIFVKRQQCSDKLWKHAPLSSNAADHSASGGVLQVDPVSDGMGIFVRRSAIGFGNITPSTITIALQTAANGVDNFQVFGVEMVNVPQGDFFAGDGTSQYSFFLGPGNPPVQITAAKQAAGLGPVNNYSSWGSTAPLPSAFPLGWNNFYCMKYEISQDNYKSYLNGLTYVQQFNRTNNPPQSAVGALALAPAANPSRNSIAIKVQGVPNSKPAVYGCDMNGNGTFDEVGDGGNIACNYLSWPDLMAYLDWSGLRPMSEFEFEKACRGAAPGSNPNENAWSTTTSLQAQSGALSNAGTGTEVSTSSGDGLCAYGAGTNTKGPLRCGFAATSATTRFQAGAGFYGIMELSGNVMEQCVGGYNFNYSAFTSANGDGEIATNGTADMAGWPVDGGGQKGGVGRGGDWFSGSQYLRVSDRAFMVQNVNQVRDGRFGGRGVRNF